MKGAPARDDGTGPVFYDRSGRRWPLFKYISLALAVSLLTLLGLLVVSVTLQASLPQLRLPLAHALVKRFNAATTDHPTAHDHRDVAARQARADLDRYLRRATRRPATHPAVALSPGGKPRARPGAIASQQAVIAGRAITVRPLGSMVLGFYVNWDAASMTSLKANIARLDILVPEWLHLSGSTGSFVVDDPLAQARTLAYVRRWRPGLPVVPLVNNYSSRLGGWDSHTLVAMLRSPVARQHAVGQLLSYVTSNRLQGINIDFENVPPASQPALRAFMSELYHAFHPRGLQVSMCVPLDDLSYDCGALARTVDFLVVMAYDQHCVGTPAGPIASQTWFKDFLQRRFAQAPAGKIVVGLGSYGYDWTGRSTAAADLTFQDALRAARSFHAVLHLDPRSLNPTFAYVDARGQPHHVWILDSVTVSNEIAQARPFQPRGYALWRLGGEDPSVWTAFDHRNDPGADPRSVLRAIPCGSGIDTIGQGEILRTTTIAPSPGVRQTTLDPQSGLVVAERIVTYPSQDVLTRWGGNSGRKIALTFDDGPDPTYTPQILSILKRYNAPATFFIIGSNGVLHPGLIQQIVAQGNEIGNHTFTHPDISAISPEQLRLELNATERMFESTVGRGSVLFRPPYGSDAEPTTLAQVAPLALASAMGYYTVGMSIDPGDWDRPGTQAIVNRVLQQAESGAGNVVLLHDGGGDRSQTVAALPAIIEGLRAHGFQLVTISGLLGLPRSAVNPVVADGTFAQATGAGFGLLTSVGNFMPRLFVAGLGLGVVWLSVLVALAVFGWGKSRRVSFATGYQPRVAVIVPAYDEEEVVGGTIRSLLQSSYPDLDIIVVDDGSTDATVDRAHEAIAGDARAHVLTKANGGKSSALNYGIERSDAEIVVALDADTVFLPETIARLVRHFADPTVAAVAGNAKVGNRDNVLTKLQALEYITSQNLDRRAFSALNCITVVPGAVGAWRRMVILEAGGFSRDTLAEDADLTIKLVRLGYRVTYDAEATAYTEAPDTIRSFFRQRCRWVYGTMQAFWKHRAAMLRPRDHAMGMLALPQAIVFKIVFPLFCPIMDLIAVSALGYLLWVHFAYPAPGWSSGGLRLLVYSVAFLLADYLAAAIALLLEGDEDWRLLPLLVLQRFFYRQVLSFVVYKSLLRAMRGELAGWGKLARRGSLATLGPPVPKRVDEPRRPDLLE